MYFALVVERVMEISFLHIHETKLDPRKKQAPLVLFLSLFDIEKSESV